MFINSVSYIAADGTTNEHIKIANTDTTSLKNNGFLSQYLQTGQSETCLI